MDIEQQGIGAAAAAAAGTGAAVGATVGAAVGLPHIMCGQSACTHTETLTESPFAIVANAVGH